MQKNLSASLSLSFIPQSEKNISDDSLEDFKENHEDCFGTLQADQLLNHEILGEGIGGVVYRSEHIETGEMIARKVFSTN